MPSYSRSYRAKRSVGRKGYSRRRVGRSGGHVPRLSKFDSREVRLEKLNFDVRPLLVTTYCADPVTGFPVAPYASTTATAAGDCVFASCPLFNLAGIGGANGLVAFVAPYNSANTGNVGVTNWKLIVTNYTEYRVRKVTCHLMLYTITSGYVATSAEAGLGDIYTLGTANTKTTYMTSMETMIFSVAWLRNGSYPTSSSVGLPAGMSTSAISVLP